MLNRIRELLSLHGIEKSAAVALADCTITRPYLLQKADIQSGTAIMMAVPYYTTICDDPARNISVYAVSRDYHLFFSRLFDEILPVLRREFSDHLFCGFADHSPIAEAEAAVRAGLGMYGKNHLFLTREYASFVFLGEIITDAALPTRSSPVTVCTDCGACAAACPVGLDVKNCVSALTQKKGDLNDAEKAALRAHGLAWGCDRCQETCSVTRAARAAGTLYTEIPFFKEQAIPHLTAAAVRAMSDQAFSERAYAWRGRDVILRNLELLEGKEGDR